MAKTLWREERCALADISKPRNPEWCLCKGILRGAAEDEAAYNEDRTRAQEGLLHINGEEDKGTEQDAQDRSSFQCHCLLVATFHYVVSVSIGTTATVMTPTPIIIDTGSGHYVSRPISLPAEWSDYITVDRALPKMARLDF